MKGIAGSLSVVVGGNQGIGAAVARELAKQGSDLVLIGRNPDTLAETLATVRAVGVTATSQQIDISDVDALTAGCALILDQAGVPRLLVNSAGGALRKDAFDVEPAEWDRLIDTHLRGTFFACQAFGRAMAAEGYGKIVNMSSTWATSAARGRSVYSTAKAGISQLTAALAVEWAPLGIRVNAVAPSATRTPRVVERHQDDPTASQFSIDRIPLGRLAEVEDVVAATLFLASKESDFVTGHTLYVDGGWQHAK
ncbi:MAG: SDR family oxidoreductase [Acidimicrobiia bacterium]